MMMHCRTRCVTPEKTREGCVYLVHCRLCCMYVWSFFVSLTRHQRWNHPSPSALFWQTFSLIADGWQFLPSLTLSVRPQQETFGLRATTHGGGKCTGEVSLSHSSISVILSRGSVGCLLVSPAVPQTTRHIFLCPIVLRSPLKMRIWTQCYSLWWLKTAWANTAA